MRRIMIMAILSSLFFITACSSSSNKDFHKQLLNAQDQMNDMEYAEAVESLSTLAESLEGDTYETGRLQLVEGLRSDAQYMVDHIEQLTSQHTEAMAAYDKAKELDELDIDIFSDAFHLLDETIAGFNEMTHLDLYKELVDARDDLIEDIDELVASLESEIEDSIKELNFTVAEGKLSDLREIQRMLPDVINESTLTAFEETIENEKERFVYLPQTVYEWNEPVVENDHGSIKVKGITATEERAQLIVSFGGNYQKLSDDIKFLPMLIFSNGDSISGTIEETRLLQDETILTYNYSFSERNIDDIVRINVEVPFVQEDDIQVAFDGIDENKTYEVPGIESIKNTHQPNWETEASNFDLIINNLIIENHSVVVEGVLKPNKDIEIDDFSTAYLLLARERETIGTGFLGSGSTTELYAGTEKEFVREYSFNTPITEHHEYMDLHLYGQNIRIDLQNGKIIEDVEITFVEDLYKRTLDTSVGFDASDQKELINQDGDRVSAESILVTGFLNRQNTYRLFNQFDTFTATVHVHEDTTGDDYGTSEIIFYSVEDDEDKELHKVSVKSKHKAKDIEVDVSGVQELKIEFNSDSGSEGRQAIILEEPMVK